MYKVFTPQTRPITMAILAMGGEGGGVLADWCVDMAEHCNYWAQTTSVPGVAQRTGTTVYYLEFYPKIEGNANEPVLSTMAAPGEVDIVVASELMEAGRAVQRGFVSPELTTFITSTHRVYSMTEKIALGDGRIDSQVLLDSVKKAAKIFIPADFAKVSEAAGSVISAALFGAVAGSGALPFKREDFIAAIERGGVGVKNSTKAFDASFELAKASVKPSSSAVSITIEKRPEDLIGLPEVNEQKIIENPSCAVGYKLTPIATRIKNDFPETLRVMLVNGVKKCADYQDVKYSELYLNRVSTISTLEAKLGNGSTNVSNEVARYSALWMSYEDTIRVADLKTRGSRNVRVGNEARIQENQMLQIREFLHPQVDEFIDTLPTALAKLVMKAKWLTKLIEKISKNGMILQTTSVHGYLLLYAIARLKPFRRKTMRYGIEQNRIDAWLLVIAELIESDYELALQVAELASLIKGYGSTHRNGLSNFELITSQLVNIKSGSNASEKVANLIKLALSDENGVNLRAALNS